MKKKLFIFLTVLALLFSSLPAFAAVYRRSANVSSEVEQYQKASEDWIKSKGSWITGEDIYFIRFGGKNIEHAVSVDEEKKTITTEKGKIYNLETDGFLQSWAGTHFYKKSEGKNGTEWKMIEWPQINSIRKKEKGSDENGEYYYYVFSYEFKDEM